MSNLIPNYGAGYSPMGSPGIMGADSAIGPMGGADAGITAWGATPLDPSSWAMQPGIQSQLAGMRPSPGMFGIDGLGKNLQTLQLGLGGLNTLGSLWGSMQALKLANKQFDFTKSVTNTNLANQIKSYNTGLEDRAANRAAFGGQPQSSADAYVAAHQLTRS